METLSHIPWWYSLIAILWSSFQGIRGAIEHNRYYEDSHNDWDRYEKWIILFIHDFAFRFVCTMAGFASLFLVYQLFGDIDNLRDISPGAAILASFLIIVGIIGVGGQLHYIILMGKWPKSN